MDIQELYKQILIDIKTTKSTALIKEFKRNIREYSKDDLLIILKEIENNTYFGEHGVDDLSWFNLKTLIAEIVK